MEKEMKTLEELIKEQEKVRTSTEEKVEFTKEAFESITQTIKNTIDAYLREKARADKLEKEYSKMLTILDEHNLLQEGDK